MFMKARLSEEDGDSRNKEGFPVIEESSLGKFCGPRVEKQGPLPYPWMYSEHCRSSQWVAREAWVTSPAKASLYKLGGEGAGPHRASEPTAVEFSVVIQSGPMSYHQRGLFSVCALCPALEP